MYDELVKRLKYAADIASLTHPTWTVLMTEAADAIEDLSREAEVNAKRAMKWAFDAERAEAKLRWIPVTERLPENCVTVLAYYNNFVSEAFYGNNQWHELATYAIISTTHWMPLPPSPEPPKEKT